MDYSKFEEVINKIGGVINSKIVVENENIIEIHILANKLRSGKQIARDVESAILVNFDYRIDRSKLSIAQIQTEDYKEVSRIKFEGLSIKTYENMVECDVRLSHLEEEYSSTQLGVNTTARRMKAVASATVRVVQQIFADQAVFDIIDVTVYKHNEISVICVLINVILNGYEEILSGSAVVRNDINEAIVKATLDAVNRRIQKI